jgi:hypothetical protein
MTCGSFRNSPRFSIYAEDKASAWQCSWKFFDELRRKAPEKMGNPNRAGECPLSSLIRS